LHPTGIEPVTYAWKAYILPLNYGCYDPDDSGYRI
jgi:hypothetical protein